MPAPLSSRDFENAIKAYLAGEGAESVAARFGTSPQRLRKVLQERGLWRSREERYRLLGQRTGATQRARNGFPDAAIVAAYVGGMSEKAVADKFGVSRPVVTARLREAGVRRRGQTEANRLMAAARTPEENRRIMQAAQNAARGRKATLEERKKTARTRQERGIGVSPAEQLMAEWLARRGVEATPQRAVGPYNVDLGAYPVAVEVFGGTWHATGHHRARAAERFDYLFNQGWYPVVIWIDRRRGPLCECAAEYVVAFLNEVRGNPSASRQYRVIWGSGEEVARGGPNSHELADIVPRRGRHGRRPRDKHTCR